VRNKKGAEENQTTEPKAQNTARFLGQTIAQLAGTREETGHGNK
jgi:hypothetical protein